MKKIFIILLIFVLTGCNSSVSKKQNPLAIEMGAFLISGKYDVQVKEVGDSLKSTKSIKAGLTITNSLGLIEFKGNGSFNDLDSISINLNDSTLLRQFSINQFIDTVSVVANKSGFDEDYFGYAFGEDNSGWNCKYSRI